MHQRRGYPTSQEWVNSDLALAVVHTADRRLFAVPAQMQPDREQTRTTTKFRAKSFFVFSGQQASHAESSAPMHRSMPEAIDSESSLRFPCGHDHPCSAQAPSGSNLVSCSEPTVA